MMPATRSVFSLCRLPLCVALMGSLACRGGQEPQAFGNFEGEEVLVASQSGGQLKVFTPVEGQKNARGVVVGVVDTVQAALELNQIVAQR